MGELLTTGQMIDKLKVGEVAKSQPVEIDEISYEGYDVRKTENGGLEYMNGHALMITPTTMDFKWRILPNYVSFEDAMKALKDGKRVIFHAGEEKYQITSSWCLVNDWVNQFNWNDLMENTWTIEEWNNGTFKRISRIIKITHGLLQR